MPVAVKRAQVNIKGEWKEVPGFDLDGKTIIVHGNPVKVASVEGEEWLETEVGDPEACLNELRRRRENGLQADVFTFAQKLTEITARYGYPVEPESIAAIHIRSFKEWWESLPQETRKNVRRAERRGVTVQLAPFDDELVRGIAEVQNEAPVRQGRRYPHYG